jgi:DNA-binding NtrC family response regulator
LSDQPSKEQIEMSPSRPRILIIDDEEDTCEMLDAAFSREGFDVEARPTPKEGLYWLAHNEVELVVLDLGFYGEVKILTIGAILALRPETPVVVYSGYTDAHYLDHAIGSGARAFIAKPELSQLIQRVTEILKPN